MTILGVFLKSPTNRLRTTDHLPTDQPITFLRPPTNQPLTKSTDHQPTDHRPIRNMKARNSITNFIWISDKKIWDRVINTTSRMWVSIFWLKPEYGIQKIKSLFVKLNNYKTYGNCIWIKRIKTGKNIQKLS